MGLLHILLIFLLRKSLATEGSVNQKLTDDLLSKKSRHLRPVDNPRDQLTVNVVGALYQIVDVVCACEYVFASVLTIYTWWNDSKMQWNPVEYNETKEMYLPSAEVWVPELFLYHSIQGSTPITMSEWAVQVSYMGEVRIFFPFTARALCPINVKYFPFDKQRCQFTVKMHENFLFHIVQSGQKFGSWSYKMESVNFDVKTKEVFLDDFYDNQEWILLKSELFNGVAEYNTTYHKENYSTVIMELLLQREHFYYIFNLMIPTTLVTVVAIIGFHAPANSTLRRETKFRLGIMTLLSMGVMLLMVVEEMPKFSLTSTPGQRGSFSDVPILGIYYIFLIGCISFCTCSSAVFVLLERYAMENPAYEKIPVYLGWIAFDCPAFLFFSGNKQKHQGKNVYTLSIQSPVCDSPSSTLESAEDKKPQFASADLNQKQRNYKHSLTNVHSSSSDQTVRSVPLHLGSSRYHARSGYNTHPGPDPMELLARPLEHVTDLLSIICQRLLRIQSKLDNLQSAASQNFKENPRHCVEGTSRCQSAASRETPKLTETWHRIILRLEMFSLTLYLVVIVSTIILVINHDWY